MSRGGSRLCAVLVAGALAACVTDHQALEKKPGSGQGGAASGGAFGGAGFPTQLGGSGGDVSSVGGHADDEPPGTSVLTIVNGVVDAPSVAWCFTKVDSEGNVAPFGSPLTDAPLAYGEALVLHDIAGADLDADTLAPQLIAGDLELIAGLDCESAIALARSEEARAAAQSGSGAAGEGAGGAAESAAGASGSASAEGGTLGDSSAGAAGAAGTGGPPAAVRSRLRVRGLPAIPAGTLNSGRSLVLAANGCMGGATYSGEHAELYCGAGFTEQAPTLSAVLVELSRKAVFDHVGMQVLNASLANAQIEVRSRAPSIVSQSSGLSIASNVVSGQVAPRPASVLSTAADYDSAKNQLNVVGPGSSLFGQSWLSALGSGGLKELANGVTYAVVVSGPRADQKAVVGLWNAPFVTAVAAEPE